MCPQFSAGSYVPEASITTAATRNVGQPIKKKHTGPACDFFCKWPAAEKKGR
jgi:hypothetical protein